MDEDYEISNARIWNDAIPPSTSNDDQGKVGRPSQYRRAFQPTINTRGDSSSSENQYRLVGSSHRQRASAPGNRSLKQTPTLDTTRSATRSTGEGTQNRAVSAMVAVPRHTLLQPLPIGGNNGQTAWRQREQPTETVKINAAVALAETDYSELQQIALDNACYLHCIDPAMGQAFLTFGIWGDKAMAQLVKDEIVYKLTHITSQNDRPTAEKKFAKVSSLTPAQREKAEKKWINEVRKNRFRQHPPLRMEFDCIGSFTWPVKELKPDGLLGNSYEALDPVRMENACYITWEEETSVFRVMGKTHAVKDALLRIRGTCFQIAARSTHPARAYLPRWDPDAQIPTHVYLEKYTEPLAISESVLKQAKLSVSPRADGICEDDKEAGLARKASVLSTERIRVTLANAVRKLCYFQGHLQLRIHLGTFLFTQYMRPEHGMYELRDYENMTKLSQFSGRVTKELGDQKLEQTLLEKVQHGQCLLEPQDVTMENLSDVKPIYSVVFIIEDPKGDLRLYKSWREIEDAHRKAGTNMSSKTSLMEVETKWTRLDRDTGHPALLLDMSLTDLHTGSAWQFEISSARYVNVPTLAGPLRRFSESVKIKEDVATQQFPKQPFVSYSAHIRPKLVRESISYRYGITRTDYTLEVARAQDRIFPSVQSRPEHWKIEEFEPRWTVNVFRTDWDTMFARNERLVIGKGAEWSNEFESWFPDDIGPYCEAGGDGYNQLVEKLYKIEKLLRAEEESDE